jgi:hypothetical protein
MSLRITKTDLCGLDWEDAIEALRASGMQVSVGCDEQLRPVLELPGERDVVRARAILKDEGARRGESRRVFTFRRMVEQEVSVLAVDEERAIEAVAQGDHDGIELRKAGSWELDEVGA